MGTQIKNELLNKVALVTGGAHRLGRQIALYLAKEGYDLAIIYNSTSKAEILKTDLIFKSLGVKYKLYKCDLKNLPQVKNTVNKIGADFRKIDLLVNNSGVIKKIEFEDIRPELFDDTIAVNLRAPLFLTQYSLKYLRKSKNPLVINMASLGGLQNWTGLMPYSISKTAVIKLTYLLAKKLAPQIRVNAIAPGTIIVEGEEGGTPSKIAPEKIPLKKYGKSEDIIEAVKFIINCEYLTGQVIAVEGGRLLGH